MFRHKDRVQPLTYSAATAMLHVMQARAGVSTEPTFHGVRVTGNNLSRNGNGDEMTQFHGGWLSVAGRSRYDRFAIPDVLAVPSRMLGRTPPGAAGPPVPRDVLRFSHLQRTGPTSGDPTQRLVLPEGLEGTGLTARNLPAAPAAGPSRADDRPAVRLPPHGAGLAGAAVADLDADARGSGTLLPRGYKVAERSAAHPTSASSRTWKEYFAPDGTRFQSRAAAWRHFAKTPVLPEVYDVVSESRSSVSMCASTAGSARGSPHGSLGSASPGDGRVAAAVPFDAFGRRSRAAGPSPVDGQHGIAPAGVAQRHRGSATVPSDVAALLGETARGGGAGSRLARELLD